MNKKLLLLPFMLLMMIAMVLGAPVTQSSLCSQTTSNEVTAITFLNGTAVTFFTGTTDTSYSGGNAGFNNITPGVEIILNQVCDNLTTVIIEETTLYSLNWNGLDDTTGLVYNGSNITQVVGTTNYTMGYTAGTFNLTGGPYNNSAVYVCYNKTFTTTYDLTDNKTGRYSVPSTANYGDDIAITLLDNDLNNTNWTTNQVVYARTCATRDSCNSTQLAIFAGFGLLALAAIVLAAFLLISIFTDGNVAVAGMSAVVLGIVGLGIVLIIGYFIISKVGSSVCLI